MSDNSKKPEDKVEVGWMISNVSGYATDVAQQLQQFMQVNPNLQPDTKAIIVKSQEGFNGVSKKLAEVTERLEEAGRWRNRAKDWFFAGIVGFVIGYVLQYAITYLMTHPT